MPYPGRVVRVLHEVAAQEAFNAIIGEIVEGPEHLNPVHKRARIGLASNRRGVVTAQGDLLSKLRESTCSSNKSVCPVKSPR